METKDAYTDHLLNEMILFDYNVKECGKYSNKYRSAAEIKAKFKYLSKADLSQWNYIMPIYSKCMTVMRNRNSVDIYFISSLNGLKNKIDWIQRVGRFCEAYNKLHER